jgi:hypothetical protein
MSQADSSRRLCEAHLALHATLFELQRTAALAVGIVNGSFAAANSPMACAANNPVDRTRLNPF